MGGDDSRECQNDLFLPKLLCVVKLEEGRVEEVAVPMHVCAEDHFSRPIHLGAEIICRRASI
jgi:hypothetical protein